MRGEQLLIVTEPPTSGEVESAAIANFPGILELMVRPVRDIPRPVEEPMYLQLDKINFEKAPTEIGIRNKSGITLVLDKDANKPAFIRVEPTHE